MPPGTSRMQFMRISTATWPRSAPATGRHPLPQPEQFAATLTRWGMTPSTQVVAYDADNAAYAARLWWLLRWVGHPTVAVLDGGFKAWTAPDCRRPPRCHAGAPVAS